MKNTVRLTEAQLHRVIKESVKRVLNEIKWHGQSLHGNNPEDWETVGQERYKQYEKYHQKYVDAKNSGWDCPKNRQKI